MKLLPAILTAAALIAAPAFADDSDDDEFSFLEEGDRAAAAAQDSRITGDEFDMFGDEEEEDLADFALRAEVPKTAAPAVGGKKPLAGNFSAKVVDVLGSSVVVELPVLVGNGGDLAGSDYWLIGEVFVAGRKVGESRQLITSDGLSQGGPTLAYLKVSAPVQGQFGQVELRVSKLAQGAAEASKERLFARKADYRL